jgi:hypothetical protein
MLGRQGRYQFAEITFHDLSDLVQGEVDPVVCDTTLRKIVSADPLRSITTAESAIFAPPLSVRRTPLT